MEKESYIQDGDIVDGIQIHIHGIDDLTKEEVRSYFQSAKQEIPKNARLVDLTISSAKDAKDVQIDYTFKAPKFERIRRITGYLVGTIDRWNNAKRAEEKDRVKHCSTFTR